MEQHCFVCACETEMGCGTGNFLTLRTLMFLLGMISLSLFYLFVSRFLAYKLLFSRRVCSAILFFEHLHDSGRILCGQFRL
ncbi:hypothetical protein OIU78_020878 [Salix suchowensis]|nr:hypothetical protein OIU78_020878 [Salix suchowensis]